MSNTRKPTNFYAYQYMTPGKYYYIHAHLENIGRINNIAQNMSEVERLFTMQKQNISKQAVSHYKFLLGQSMTDKSRRFLESITDENKGNQIIDELNKAVIQDMEKKLDSEFFENLRKLSEKANNLPDIYKDVNLASDALNKKQLQEAFGQINEILDIIQEGCKLTEKGSNYEQLLLTTVLNKGKEGKTLAAKSSKMLKEIAKIKRNVYKITKKNKDNFKLVPENHSFKENELYQILNELEKFANKLNPPKDEEDSSVTLSSLKGSLTKNILPETFGEAGAYIAPTMAKQQIWKAVVDGTEFKTTGKDQTVKIDVYESNGQMKTRKVDNVLKSGKADSIQRNYHAGFTTKVFDNEGTKVDFTFNLGISSKLYTSAGVPQPNGTVTSGNVSVGGGMTVGRAIDLSFRQIGLRYLAYNAFAYQDYNEVKPALYALQDDIFTRSIVNIFGARGIDDFAMIIVVNGKPYSLWEIIQYAINNNIGKTASVLKAEGLDKKSVLSFSIDGEDRQAMKITNELRPNLDQYSDPNFIEPPVPIEVLNNYVEHRAKTIGNAIRKAKISAHFNPSRLLNLR